MLRKKLILLYILFCFFVIPLFIREIKGIQNTKLNKQIYIGPEAIGMPYGYILLIHFNKKYYAIKYLHPEKISDNNEWCANYESYCKNHEDNINLMHKDKVCNLNPSEFFRCQRGKFDIWCGDDLFLLWSGNGKISWTYFFSSNQNGGDYGIELAPTKWSEKNEINFNNSSLKWFRYDISRETIAILL